MIMFDVKIGAVTYHTGIELTGQDLTFFNKSNPKCQEKFLKALISRRVKIENIEVK